MLELATRRSAQTVGFRLPVQRISCPDESFRGYHGIVAGGSVKPGDSVVVLPAGTVAKVKQIVTFDLLRNAAVAGDGSKRYWLKSSSRRQRLRVQPQAVLDLNSGQWNEAEKLSLNTIGTVQLAFGETAMFDPYEANRNTGAFVLIDPDTYNTGSRRHDRRTIGEHWRNRCR